MPAKGDTAASFGDTYGGVPSLLRDIVRCASPDHTFPRSPIAHKLSGMTQVVVAHVTNFGLTLNAVAVSVATITDRVR
jgi:hypothetical protein